MKVLEQFVNEMSIKAKIGLTIGGLIALKLGADTIGKKMDKICGKFKTVIPGTSSKEKKQQLYECQLKVMNKYKGDLEAVKSQCSEAQSPALCKTRMDMDIAGADNSIKSLKKKLEKLKE